MVDGMKKYAIGVVLGVLVGVLLYYALPIHWEGEALIRTGKNSPGYPIENMSIITERLKSHFFVRSVGQRANNNEIIELLDIDKGSALSFKPIKGNEVSVIKVTAYSPTLAQISIEAVVAELIAQHNELQTVYQANLYRQIAELESEINSMTKRYDLSMDKLIINTDKTSSTKELATLLMFIENKNNLNNQINLLEIKKERLSRLLQLVDPGIVNKTELLGPVSISEKRIFSKLWRACLFGSLGGILFIAIWVRWNK